MPPHPLTNFEIQEYDQNEHQFNGVYSRNNLSKIKDGEYIINLDKSESIGSHWHWVGLYAKTENITYYDVFELNTFQKKLEKSSKIKLL